MKSLKELNADGRLARGMENVEMFVQQWTTSAEEMLVYGVHLVLCALEPEDREIFEGEPVPGLPEEQEALNDLRTKLENMFN